MSINASKDQYKYSYFCLVTGDQLNFDLRQIFNWFSSRRKP